MTRVWTQYPIEPKHGFFIFLLNNMNEENKENNDNEDFLAGATCNPNAPEECESCQ